MNENFDNKLRITFEQTCDTWHATYSDLANTFVNYRRI